MPTYFEKYGHTLITLAAISAAFVGLVTIDGNRFHAQDRLIDQRFEAVNQRFDAQDRLMDQRFEAVDRRFDAVDQRFDGVDQRFDGHDKRLDRLSDEVSELRRLMVGIGERVSRNEGEIDVIREQPRIADTPSP